MVFMEILVTLLTASEPSCDAARAVAVGEERAQRAGLDLSHMEAGYSGPHDWSSFRTKFPRVAKTLGEPLTLFLEQHRFFFVRLTHKWDPNGPWILGGHLSFIDASTCEVLYSRQEG